MQDFQELQVWQKAHELTLEIYKLTQGFPVEERFGLQSQIRRAAVSIASNIAEGCGRGSDADFARFLQMASGSVSEVKYQLILARDLGYISRDDGAIRFKLASEVEKMLKGLTQKVSSGL